MPSPCHAQAGGQGTLVFSEETRGQCGPWRVPHPLPLTAFSQRRSLSSLFSNVGENPDEALLVSPDTHVLLKCTPPPGGPHGPGGPSSGRKEGMEDTPDLGVCKPHGEGLQLHQHWSGELGRTHCWPGGTGHPGGQGQEAMQPVGRGMGQRPREALLRGRVESGQNVGARSDRAARQDHREALRVGEARAWWGQLQRRVCDRVWARAAVSAAPWRPGCGPAPEGAGARGWLGTDVEC